MVFFLESVLHRKIEGYSSACDVGIEIGIERNAQRLVLPRAADKRGVNQPEAVIGKLGDESIAVAAGSRLYGMHCWKIDRVRRPRDINVAG